MRDGNMLDHRDVLMFDQTTKSDFARVDDDGIAWQPDVEIKFVAEPGTLYAAFIGATVSGDQSGVGLFADSLFRAYLHLSIPWLVVELRS